MLEFKGKKDRSITPRTDPAEDRVMLLLPRADATAVTNTAAPALTTVVATAAADATLLLPYVPLPYWRESSHSSPASPGPDLVSIDV